MDRQRIVNGYVANVPGPPVPLYLTGARVLELIPVVPLTGNVTLGVGSVRPNAATSRLPCLFHDATAYSSPSDQGVRISCITRFAF
jgi:hypothetical protein